MYKSVCFLSLFIFCTILSGVIYRLDVLFQDECNSQRIQASSPNQICYITSDSLIYWSLDTVGRPTRGKSVGRPFDEWVQDVVIMPGDSARSVDIWLASSAGLLNYSGLQWKKHREILANQIAAGKNGEIWMIANGTLLKRSEGQFKQMVSDMKWQSQVFGVSCFTLDRQGFPWIGMMGPAIIRFNGTELDTWLGIPAGSDTDEPGWEDGAPSNLYFDVDNNPWVEYSLGAACWKDDNWVELDLTGFGFEWGANNLAADDQGIIWASDGGDQLLCFDGEEWYVPEIQGADFPQEGTWIEDIITGPKGSMLFTIASEGDFETYIKVNICQLDLESTAEQNLETSQSVKRSYRPPVPSYPSDREKAGLKGPVKSVFSEQMDLPTYFSYWEYFPDGKIKTSAGGRTSMNSETSYWYNDQGSLSKEQTIEYCNGEELENSQTLYQYEYDELGYPVKITIKSNYGEFTEESQFVYVYADTTYSKEWREASNEYSTGYEYRETYDSKGRIVSNTVTNLADGSFSMNKYSYIPDRHITIEEYEWNGNNFNKKEVTIHNLNGAMKEWTQYDGSGTIQAKETNTLNANDHIVSSVYYNAEEGTTSRSTFEYTYDAYGNPISVVCTVDGEVDYEQSSTIIYEYY